MRDIVNTAAWRDLGGGKMAPARSINDPGLASLLSNYKRHVAGSYRSVAPDEIETSIPPGHHIVSEKIDGETWFLHVDRGNAVLLSPTGKALEGVPVIREAEQILSGWSGVLAGELYATVNTGRPRVFDLHAALGREPRLKRLRFTVFDILRDGDSDAQELLFADRVERLQALLMDGDKIHPAYFDTVDGPDGVEAVYKQIVEQSSAEGIVVHTSDHRILKLKPEITIDAAVVGYVESPSSNGISELVLALQREDGIFQLVGRVRTGWTREQQRTLRERLGALKIDSSYRMVSDHGVLIRWVKPTLVVEMKCNDLIASNSRDEPIRRMQMEYRETDGWRPLRPAPAASMINTVFRGVREDKRVALPDVRWSQIADLVPIASPATTDPATFPASEIIRREAYAKRLKAGTAVRKLVVWKTNKHNQDPLFPGFVAHFTDYSPGRKDPLKTDIRVAGREARIHEFADDWLAGTIKRGWEQVVATPAVAVHADEVKAPAHGAAPLQRNSSLSYELTIGLARSSSPSFPIVRRRLTALAKLGSLEIMEDDKGREAWFELTIEHRLVENARRIANLLKIVRPWKTTEISLNGELIGKYEVDDVLNRLETVRRCWMKRKGKAQGALSCSRSCDLGCDSLRVLPAHEFLEYSGCGVPPWWTVGSFDDECLSIDKTALREQVLQPRNAEVHLCPHFDRDILLSKIDGLPDAITVNGEEWVHLYHRDTDEPIWIWPGNKETPPRLCTEPNGAVGDGGLAINIQAGDLLSETTDADSSSSPAIPLARYADVQGQDPAVEAVRDLIELPLKHAYLFEQIGAKPQATGVILAGPPGTGKTLLAKAVAGECGAHVEFVNGPELLSKWIGATEEALRGVFSRAKEFSPSIVLFDEIDSIAGARDGSEGRSQSHNSIVAQLLTLMDGLEDRGQIFLIATTNRVESIDPALRRPGRFDQVVWMGPPDEGGRKAIFLRYLEGLRVEKGLELTDLAARLARFTPGFTGADIAFATRRAVLLCVKEAATGEATSTEPAIRVSHFEAAVLQMRRVERPARTEMQVQVNLPSGDGQREFGPA